MVRYPRSDRDQAGSSRLFFSSFTVSCWGPYSAWYPEFVCMVLHDIVRSIFFGTVVLAFWPSKTIQDLYVVAMEFSWTPSPLFLAHLYVPVLYFSKSGIELQPSLSRTFLVAGF